MNKLLPDQVKIELVYEKEDKFGFKDTKGNWYSNFKQWKGTNTDAYNSFLFANHGNKLAKGQTVNITYEQNGDFKNVKTILPVGSEVDSEADAFTAAEESKEEYNNKTFSNKNSYLAEPTYQKEVKGNDAFGRRLAIHGFVNAILSSGVEPDNIDYSILKSFLYLEDRINEALETNLPPVGDKEYSENPFK